jgi:hypothetical protein
MAVAYGEVTEPVAGGETGEEGGVVRLGVIDGDAGAGIGDMPGV